MTYNLSIDLEFAVVNDLSLVQVSTLAAFMTLPLWSRTVAIDGAVWYQYSDEKMAEDFPLLFGVPKRCYKNVFELAALGFVELTKLGRTKFVRFTGRCADWNKEKDRKRTNSPKTDSEKSENGPKTDSSNNNYNINNSDIIDNKNTADGGLFSNQEEKTIVKKPRKTSEPACLFADSRYSDFSLFEKEFTAPEFAGIDIVYYYNAVADWSSQKGKKTKDWIATTRSFIRGDLEKNKLHRLAGMGAQLPPDAIRYLQRMGKD